MTRIKPYIAYLLVRFQLIPLSILVASDVLVISRIADLGADHWKAQFAVFAMVMFYLFGNRVGDDKRDYVFDAEHYPDRAVQRGAIGLKRLERLAYVAGVAMILLAIYFGKISALLVVPLWLFSLWAKHDFSLPSSFKEVHFFTYNFLNMLQMLVLQMFIYASLLDTLRFTPLIWLHIAFVFVLSLQVEVTRKVKVASTSAGDMYSDHLGMARSIGLWMMLGILSIVLSTLLAMNFATGRQWLIAYATLWLVIMGIGAAVYYKAQKAEYEGVFWAAMIASYTGQNIMLAYA